MKDFQHTLKWLAMVLVLAPCGVALAQEPPFDLALETNPAVRAAVELPRTEPSHYLSAIVALANLGRSELAVPILKELQALNLNEAQQAELVAKFGSHRMLQLTRNEVLAPAGGEFAESCMAAAAARFDVRPADQTDPRAAIEAAIDEAKSRRLQKLLATADATTLSAALRDALESDDVRAAVALAEALGRSEDASTLYANSPRPAALADALVYPSLRVRSAALEAIVSLDPQSPFPGSSRVPQTLEYLATATGERRAIVLMPRADHATTIAGRLVGMGIAAEPAFHGLPAMRMAQQSANLEMVLVDFDIHAPGIRDMLYALRTDPATGRIPIGLLVTSKRLADAKQLAAEHDRVIAFPRPQSDEWLAHVVAELNKLAAGDQPSPDERAEIGRQARAWAEAHGN